MTISPRRAGWAGWTVVVIVAAVLVALLVSGPIAQDPAYHAFADDRRLEGIPNFWNVVSNAPFALVGLCGLVVLGSARKPGLLQGLSPAYAAFFVGSILIGLGSSWYHLNPNNETLIWDRMPLTISFMAFVAIIIGEHVSVQAARRWLPILLAAGLASVAYWAVTERAGRGDLRPYALVQFLPIVLLPIVVLARPSELTRVWLIWLVLLFYGAAKLFERLDPEVYRLTGAISGHTIKHLLAAAGMFMLVIGLRVRRAREPARLGPAR